MYKTTNEDKDDKGYNRKLNHPSVLVVGFPSALTEFHRYFLPILANLNGNLQELGPAWYREEPDVNFNEIEDWDDPMASQLEELLLSNLQALFLGVISLLS